MAVFTHQRLPFGLFTEGFGIGWNRHAAAVTLLLFPLRLFSTFLSCTEIHCKALETPTSNLCSSRILQQCQSFNVWREGHRPWWALCCVTPPPTSYLTLIRAQWRRTFIMFLGLILCSLFIYWKLDLWSVLMTCAVCVRLWTWGKDLQIHVAEGEEH